MRVAGRLPTFIKFLLTYSTTSKMLLTEDYDPIEGLPVLMLAMRDAPNSIRGCMVANMIRKWLEGNRPPLDMVGAKNKDYVIITPSNLTRSDEVYIYGPDKSIMVRHAYHGQGHLKLVRHKIPRHIVPIDIEYNNYFELTKQDFDLIKSFCDE